VADSIENGMDFLYVRPFVEDDALNWDVIVDE
jgi:hypothetical protein